MNNEKLLELFEKSRTMTKDEFIKAVNELKEELDDEEGLEE